MCVRFDLVCVCAQVYAREQTQDREFIGKLQFQVETLHQKGDALEVRVCVCCVLCCAWCVCVCCVVLCMRVVLCMVCTCVACCVVYVACCVMFVVRVSLFLLAPWH